MSATDEWTTFVIAAFALASADAPREAPVSAVVQRFQGYVAAAQRPLLIEQGAPDHTETKGTTP